MSFLLMILGILGSFAVWRYYRRLARRLQCVEQEVLRLKREIRALCAGALGVSQTVTALDTRVNHIVSRQEHLDLRQAETVSYTHATRMAHMGAGVEELVSSCGMRRAEAELVMVLHKKPASTSPSPPSVYRENTPCL